MASIALHDSDQTGFPNYALMKISAWHKAQGDSVEWFNPLFTYDRVYSSKVFTFTPEDPYLPPDTVKGGTGYGLYDALPEEIDRMFPDYSIYPDCDFATGFITRGCIRQCPWCCVSKKEGLIHPYREWTELVRPGIRKMVFMDNNVLASPFGISQMESMVGKKVLVDFNQGLDARLMTPEIVDILKRLKWCAQIRIAADSDEVLDVCLEKIALMKSKGIKPRNIFVFVLMKDIPSAERRVMALRETGVYPFVQPYRDFENKIEPTLEQKRFARWVNRREIFKTVPTFEEFNAQYRSMHRKGLV